MILLLLTIHMMRGTPYIYQGEELGMTNAHYSDISQYRDVESLNYYEILLSEGKSKEETLEILAAKSRDNSRTPMQWSADVNAGFSEAEPWISVIDNYKEINAEKEMQDPDSIYSFYKKLVGLRKEKAVISEGTIEFFERENADVLAYKRNYKEEELVVFNNLTGGKSYSRRNRSGKLTINFWEIMKKSMRSRMAARSYWNRMRPLYWKNKMSASTI